MINMEEAGRVSRRGKSIDWVRQCRLAIILVVPVISWTLVASVLVRFLPLMQ